MISAMTHTTNTTTTYGDGADVPTGDKPASTAVGRPDPTKKHRQVYDVPVFDFERAESEMAIPDAKSVSVPLARVPDAKFVSVPLARVFTNRNIYISLTV